MSEIHEKIPQSVAAEQAAQPARSAQPARHGRGSERARLRVLAGLLEDDSARVLGEVERHLLGAGRAARPALLRAAASSNPGARVRARKLLADVERRPPVRRALAYLLGGRAELERGLLILARISDQRFDGRSVGHRLDALAREVALRAKSRTDPLQRALALVEVLGAEHGFRGAESEFHRADHIHLQRVLETKRGIPLTLCAIYDAVARRAGLRVGLLPLPGHVLLRLQGDGTSLIVDPYHRGEVRSEKDLRRQLRARGLGFRAEWFQDAGASAILRRHVANLARSAETYGRKGELRDLRAILRALEPRRAAGAATR